MSMPHIRHVLELCLSSKMPELQTRIKNWRIRPIPFWSIKPFNIICSLIFRIATNLGSYIRDEYDIMYFYKNAL